MAGRDYAAITVDFTPSYDSFGRVTRHQTLNTSSVGVNFAYTYDNNSNIISKIFDHRTADPANIYSYDDLDRVTMADYEVPDPDEDEQFVYDILGNRITLNPRVGANVVYASNTG